LKTRFSGKAEGPEMKEWSNSVAFGSRFSRRRFFRTAGAAGLGALAARSARAQQAADKPPPGPPAAGRQGSRVVRIAAVQLRNVVEGKTPEQIKAFHRGNIERSVADAARRGTDIVCFCEIAATYGIRAPRNDREVWEEATDGPTAKWAAALARRHAIHLILPMNAYHAGAFRNLAVLFDKSGRIVGVYCKVHLTWNERQSGTVPGDSFPVFDLPFGKIGIIICHDMSFPESVRCLMLGDAEVVFWPTMWSGWGDELSYTVIRSRAIDNAVYLVHVGLAPPPGKFWRPGMNMARSGVIDPYGNHLSNAGFEEGIAVAEVDLDRKRIAPSFTAGPDDDFRAWVLADRRPETYGIIADPLLRGKPPV
jgi:predicted amidohydrolase